MSRSNSAPDYPANCQKSAPGVGLEPTTSRLTVERICQLSYPGSGYPGARPGTRVGFYASRILLRQHGESGLHLGVTVRANKHALARLSFRLLQRIAQPLDDSTRSSSRMARDGGTQAPRYSDCSHNRQHTPPASSTSICLTFRRRRATASERHLRHLYPLVDLRLKSVRPCWEHSRCTTSICVSPISDVDLRRHSPRRVVNPYSRSQCRTVVLLSPTASAICAIELPRSTKGSKSSRFSPPRAAYLSRLTARSPCFSTQ